LISASFPNPHSKLPNLPWSPLPSQTHTQNFLISLELPVPSFLPWNKKRNPLGIHMPKKPDKQNTPTKMLFSFQTKAKSGHNN
jgi:hypothetical protein